MAKGNLLIIDDEASIAEDIKFLLEDVADNIYTAGSGQEGIQLVQDQQIDCIICDVRMPKMDGFEVVRILRDQGYNKPFIFNSGHAYDMQDESIAKFKIFAFLEKPNFDNLEELVTKALLEAKS